MNEYTAEQIKYAAKELAVEIKQARRQAQITPATSDVVYLQDAVELCNIGTNGDIMNTVLMKQMKADQFDTLDNFFKKHGPLLMIIAGCFAAIMITYLILTYAPN